MLLKMNEKRYSTRTKGTPENTIKRCGTHIIQEGFEVELGIPREVDNVYAAKEGSLLFCRLPMTSM